MDLNIIGKSAKLAASELCKRSANEKNNALLNIAIEIDLNREKILNANLLDLKSAKDNGISPVMIDRLRLSDKRIDSIIEGVKKLIALDDPVGEVAEMKNRPNGLLIGKKKVPIGVIAIIFESRPNVSVDAATLCLKTSNAVILRGGKEAINSNIALVETMQSALEKSALPKTAIQLVKDITRESSLKLMKLSSYVDVLIPRGGAGLIKAAIENSTVAVIETGIGNCHAYIDCDADIDMAVKIVNNAKTQRPSVCNSIETLLVCEDIAKKALPLIKEKLDESNVELLCCEKSLKILPDTKPATEQDYYCEFLDYTLAVKVVDNIDEAIFHISKYGSKHSECIITNSYENSQRFLNQVDAACVYVNASTRFTDGFEFGMGAELGISTQKIHARGPMGLDALTSTKYIIYGNGQIRE